MLRGLYAQAQLVLGRLLSLVASEPQSPTASMVNLPAAPPPAACMEPSSMQASSGTQGHPPWCAYKGNTNHEGAVVV